jgi:tripartite-type tricarboxylate transporter receptor subunit TctC
MNQALRTPSHPASQRQRWGSARRAAVLLLALVAALGIGVARAEDPYPNKPVRIVVAYGAGGANDIIARIVAKSLGEALGQTILVVNQPGAGGMLGASSTARAVADGYTLLMGAGAHALAPSLYRKLSYDIVKDFAPIGLVGGGAYVLSVNNEVPVKTVAELVASGKKPGVDLRFVSSGVGAPPHLAGELFRSLSGAHMTHVPYKSEPESLTDLMAARVEMGFITVSNATPLIRSGRLRGLAVSSKLRSAVLPELPTLAELGFADFDVSTWWGLFAPAGTPRPIVDKLHSALTKIVADPRHAAALAAQGMEVRSSRTPEDFAGFVLREKERYAVIVKSAGIEPE